MMGVFIIFIVVEISGSTLSTYRVIAETFISYLFHYKILGKIYHKPILSN